MKTNKSIVEEYKKMRKEKEKEKILIPTGIDLIDCMLNGGIPVGTIFNLVGEESSGKSYLATEIIANAKLKLKDKYDVKHFYDDAETGYSFNTKPIYGFDIVNENDSASETVEGFALNLKKQLAKLDDEQFLIYTLDSLDGLSSLAEKQRDKKLMNDLEKGNSPDGSYQMEKQKYLKSFFRVRSKEIKNKNCILVIISQVIYNMANTLFKTKYTRAGGKGLDHFSYCTLWLKEAKPIIKKGIKIGSRLKLKTTKLKDVRSERECYVDLIKDYGFDNVRTNINYLYDLLTDTGEEKKNKKVQWGDNEFTAVKLIDFIEENNLEDELSIKVRQKWDDIEESVSSSGRKNKWEAK